MTTKVSRSDVLRFRVHRHQLDREQESADDVDLLDYGIQATGSDGAPWVLAIRGHERSAAANDELALAWTLRGAPHAYRLADLDGIAVATSPFSEADAAKRIYDAAKPLRAAGMSVIDGLRVVAETVRDVVASPMEKGDVSGALNAVLPEPFLRSCRPCGAVHIYEMPFRLAALQAGLELEPDTSPPVLRRVARLEPRRFSTTGAEAEPRFHVVRSYLRFFGPARPADAATFLDSAAKDVTAEWPSDAVEVSVDGEPRWILGEDLEALTAPPSTKGLVRLLGPYDPYLQLRDRELLLPDAARRKELWPTLGRPGAVLLDGEVVGSWRPRQSGKKLSLELVAWSKLTKRHLAAIDEQAGRLAAFRGVQLAGIKQPG